MSEIRDQDIRDLIASYEASVPSIREYVIAPGWWNAVRFWIKQQVRFSTYHRRIAPIIGWPRTVLRRPGGQR